MANSRKHTSIPFFAIGGLVAGTLVSPQIAQANDDLIDGEPAPVSARSAEAGAFLTAAMSPRAEGRRGLVAITAGYNDSRGGATYDATAAATVFGPVTLSAGAAYDGPDTRTEPHVELQVHALRQARHGIDLAVAGGYTDAGLNTVPAAIVKVALGRNLGPAYLLANMELQVGFEEAERAGAARLAALYPVTRAVHVGVDSRFQIDLERDDDEPEAEVDWEWRGEGVASYSWNRLVFTGAGGISALRMRGGGGEDAVGPVVTAGVATVF